MNNWFAYLAAPLFNERERRFNSELADALSRYCDVFLPQRDGLLLADLLRDGVPSDVAETRIFERDRVALNQSNLLIAVLDGAHIDEGVAFEIGFAHARGALCLGLQSDVRRALPSGNNPMIGRAMSAIFTDVAPLIAFLAEHRPSDGVSGHGDRQDGATPSFSRSSAGGVFGRGADAAAVRVDGALAG